MAAKGDDSSRPGSAAEASTAKHRVLLLDSYSLAFRAFFALPETLVTSSGQVTNAVFGFTSMLFKLESEERPDAVIACMDKGEPQFRLDQYPAYKAGRSETPQTLRGQFPLIREVLEALCLPVVELEGYEADDLLATLARRGREAGHHVIIVSGDRDCLQLVNDDVTVLMTRRGVTDMIRYDPAMVVERYGVGPERWTDFAALKGEQADNLPGVPGVGDKTAARLLEKYGDIEGIIEHAAELTPKIRKGIEECADQVKLNRKLGRLLDDVPLETDASVFERRPWDPETVRRLFTSLEFRTLYERFLALAAPGAAPPAAESVIRPESISQWASGADVPAAGSVAVAWDDGMAALCARPGEVGMLPLDGAAGAAAVLADAGVAKAVYEAKPLYGAMLRNGGRLRGVRCDLKIAAYLLDPGASGGYALKDIVARHLDAALDEEAEDGKASEGGGHGARGGSAGAEEAPAGGVQGDLLNSGDEDREQAQRRRRLASEAAAVQAAAAVLEARLEEAGSWELAQTLEFPLTEVLARMEHAGILVDDGYLGGLNRDLGERMDTLQAKVQEHAGETFNVNSHPQLSRILFDKLGLPKTKKIKTGYSTDAAELGKLAGRHPIIDTLLEYREVAKLRTGFTDSLLSLVNQETGRIHTTYEQAAAATGRLSSSAPNLQNIPIRADLGRQIRRAFVAPPDNVLLSADYSQIELRVLAHLSEDPSFLDAFAHGHDFHAATAAKVFGVPVDGVTTEMRGRVKQFSYGIAYGMSAFGVSQRLGIEVGEAREFIDAYYAQFPGVKAFLDAQVERARVDGFTTTMFGRRRYLPELQSSNFRMRAVGERMALNAPIQGTAADIMKRAMIAVDEALLEQPVARMLLTVHDELVFEVPRTSLEEATGLVKECMEGAAELRCGLVVDVHTGENWAEAHA
ncbi:MAG: DNA polymerase I [Deltaproteobacteria bacterium]|nr:DNA polymerase I [Deltaproteobacteria bacterium]